MKLFLLMTLVLIMITGLVLLPIVEFLLGNWEVAAYFAVMLTIAVIMMICDDSVPFSGI